MSTNQRGVSKVFRQAVVVLGEIPHQEESQWAQPHAGAWEYVDIWSPFWPLLCLYCGLEACGGYPHHCLAL